MNRLKFSIEIARPAKYVFNYLINPENTPKWIDGILEEIVNQQPIKKGTVYKNRRKDGRWITYVMSEFDMPRSFVMSQKDRNYHVRYTIKPIASSNCRLEYEEFVDSGDIEEPFTIHVLEKLKQKIESE